MSLSIRILVPTTRRMMSAGGPSGSILAKAVKETVKALKNCTVSFLGKYVLSHKISELELYQPKKW